MVIDSSMWRVRDGVDRPLIGSAVSQGFGVFGEGLETQARSAEDIEWRARQEGVRSVSLVYKNRFERG